MIFFSVVVFSDDFFSVVVFSDDFFSVVVFSHDFFSVVVFSHDFLFCGGPKLKVEVRRWRSDGGAPTVIVQY